MNQQQKDVWIAALRSGEYPQGARHELKNGRGQYCCLGVANDALALNSTSPAYLRRSHNPDFFLPLDVQGQLAGMNDKGIPFAKIADCIEQNVQPTE